VAAGLVDEGMTAARAPLSDRVVPLLGMVWLVAALGAAAGIPEHGAAPSPCEQPARRDGVLVCDGRGEAAGIAAWLVGQKLDVNTARQRDLEAIPDVGPSLAAAIVAARAERGGFARLAELDEVPGVGPKTLVKLERYLEVR
jgi:competence protein ComEA